MNKHCVKPAKGKGAQRAIWPRVDLANSEDRPDRYALVLAGDIGSDAIEDVEGEVAQDPRILARNAAVPVFADCRSTPLKS